MRKLIILPVVFSLALSMAAYNAANADGENQYTNVNQNTYTTDKFSGADIGLPVASTSVRNASQPNYQDFWKPFFEFYDKKNYLGALSVLETAGQKNITQKDAVSYYSAICYHNLGYLDLAKQKYSEAISNSDKYTDVAYYSKKAVACMDDPKSPECTGIELKPEYTEMEKLQQSRIKQLEEQVADLDKKLNPPKVIVEDDITKFIKSNQRIHPSAMDRITTERMERRLQEAEYARKQNAQQQK